MTTTLRAQKLRDNPTGILKKSFPTDSQDVQGLNNQPFIFADILPIASCILDMEQQVIDNLHHLRSQNYQTDNIKINTLKRALVTAGYAYTGARLSPTQPTEAQELTIAAAADACGHLLTQRLGDLLRTKDVALIRVRDSMDRYGKYQAAIHRIQDTVSVKNYHATAKTSKQQQVLACA